MSKQLTIELPVEIKTRCTTVGTDRKEIWSAEMTFGGWTIAVVRESDGLLTQHDAERLVQIRAQKIDEDEFWDTLEQGGN